MDWQSIPEQDRPLTLKIMTAIQTQAEFPLVLFNMRPMCRRNASKPEFCDAVSDYESHRLRNAVSWKCWLLRNFST